MNGHTTASEGWLARMRRQNLAPGTIEQRRLELARWLRHIGPDWRRATTAELEAFLDGRALGPSARRTAVSHLAGFYRWALGEGLAVTDPTARAIRPRQDRRLPRPVLEVDLAVALISCRDRRLRLMIGLGALAGLRCCEIAALRWVDVDVISRRLRVRGKGGRDRVVPIHEQLLGMLADAPRSSPYVLGRRFGAGYVSRVGSRGLRELGVAGTMHQLRHRFGTVAYEASGGDLLAVADLMGHGSIETTRGYAKVAALSGARLVAAMPRIGS